MSEKELTALDAETLESTMAIGDDENCGLPERARVTQMVNLVQLGRPYQSPKRHDWDIADDDHSTQDEQSPAREASSLVLREEKQRVLGSLLAITKQDAEVFAAPGWRVTQLTPVGFGSTWHSNSYFNIHAANPDSGFAAAVRSSTPTRRIVDTDTIEVATVDLSKRGFEPVGTSNAWSWQQGPMAQFTTTGDFIWNDHRGWSSCCETGAQRNECNSHV